MDLSLYRQELSLYRQELDSIAFGKRLPGAIYIVRPTLTQVPALLWELLRRAELAAQPDPQWNLLKLHSDQLALTFLTYPDFDPDPHPALAEATKINLNTGSVVRTDYRSRLNPPILHRKETFLPLDDPRHDAFAELTRQEEAAGLLRDTARIGTRVFWNSLLKKHQLGYEGHRLVSTKLPGTEPADAAPPADVQRHRTNPSPRKSSFLAIFTTASSQSHHAPPLKPLPPANPVS